MSNLLEDSLIRILEKLQPTFASVDGYTPVNAMACGCTGSCGQSCAGGCESGCSGDCGRSCSGGCS
jgi:modification target Cys-rich repeat protein